MKILVTGGAGFIGTNLIKYIPVSDFVDPTGLFKTKVNPLGYTFDKIECVKVENNGTWFQSPASRTLGPIEEERDNDPTHWLYIPFLNSDIKHPGMSVMLAKYKFCNMLGEHHDWEDYFSFKRFEEKELQLKEHVGVKEGEDFILISGIYGTPPRTKTRRIPYEGNKKIIQIKSHPGFSVFDWCWLFENASEIHMVETCFIYLLEKLRLKGKVFNLYSKFNPAFWGHIGHIPKRIKWNFCNW